MKEPKLYYTGHDKHDIRDPYPNFYYSMLKFIKSLPDTWFFKRCEVVEYDGSLFVLTLHDGKRNELIVSAAKSDSGYDFTVCNQ